MNRNELRRARDERRQNDAGTGIPPDSADKSSFSHLIMNHRSPWLERAESMENHPRTGVDEIDVKVVRDLVHRIGLSNGDAGHHGVWAASIWKVKVGIAISGVTGAIIDVVNPTFARLHGYSVEELLGRPLTDLVPLRSISRFADYLQLAHERGRASFSSMHQHKEGKTFPVQVQIDVAECRSGRISHRIISIRPKESTALVLNREAEEFFSPGDLALVGCVG